MGNGVNKRVIIYSRKSVDITKGKNFSVGYANPVLWSGKVLSRYTHVYAPDYPKIEQAYLDAGKAVYRKEGQEEVVPKKEPQKKEPEQPVNETSTDTPEESAQEANSDTTEEANDDTNWRELGWNKLRGLAGEFTEEPIKSKEQAIEVLEQAEAEGKI